MPETTVGAIITIRDGTCTKILLTQRAIDPFKGFWCLPGGHIDPRESAEQAIAREIKEETGLEFQPQFLAASMRSSLSLASTRECSFSRDLGLGI